MGAYLFLLPFSSLPPANAVRNRILQLPVVGNRYEDTVSLGIVLMPEWLFAIAMFTAAVLFAMRGLAASPFPRTAIVLGGVGALALLGSLPATLAAEQPAVALVGWFSLAAALLLSLSVILVRPAEATVRLWLIALIVGTALLCAIAMREYVEAFGIPTLADLPINRLRLAYDDYARLTYGHSGTTASIVTTMTAATLALLAAPRQSVWLRVLLALALVVFLVTLAFAFQRWAWVTVSVAAVAILWRYRSSRVGIALLVLISAVVLQLGSVIGGQLGDYFVAGAGLDAGGSNLGTRLETWRGALDLARDNPVGYGIGLTSFLGLRTVIAHNLVVDALLEGGVLYAAALAAWAAYGVGWLAVVTLRRERLSETRYAALIGGVALTSWTLFFGLTVSMSGAVILITLWFLYPALAAGKPSDQEPPTVVARREG